MNITSSAFVHQGIIPSRYTCKGEAISPALTFADVPEETKTLVLIVDDPNAVGGLFTHWLMWHISPTTKDIGESIVPLGAVEGKNSAGVVGYTAPCPPQSTGIHHYQFQLFAINKSIDLLEGATRDDIDEAINGCIIAKAELVGLYQV